MRESIINEMQMIPLCKCHICPACALNCGVMKATYFIRSKPFFAFWMALNIFICYHFDFTITVNLVLLLGGGRIIYVLISLDDVSSVSHFPLTKNTVGLTSLREYFSTTWRLFCMCSKLTENGVEYLTQENLTKTTFENSFSGTTATILS
jgi:hypothetical protein